MNRTLRLVAVAVIGLLAVSIAASTLDSAQQSGSTGPGESGGGSVLPNVTVEDTGGEFRNPIPWQLSLALFALSLLPAVWYLVAEWRKLLKNAVLLALGALVLYVLLRFLVGVFGDGSTEFGFGGGSGGGLFGDGTQIAQPTSPSLGLLVVLVVVVVVGVVALFAATGDVEVGPGGSDPDPAAEDGGVEAGIGRAAGRAADSIERSRDADVDNEVYRAWREMTTFLDVADPRATTPREFADAAVDAGLDDRDVEELTALFREVRYGGNEVSEADEQRAVATFRRIEAAYAEDA